ncbi:hypothetical protein BGX26_011126, partial [Mortierella sp. AD094]
ASEIEARASPSIGALLPIAFLESLPLPQDQPNHASLQPKDCSEGSGEIQHVEKENANINSLSPLLSHAIRRRPRSKGMSSNLNDAAYSYLRAINRSHPLSSLGGDVSGLGRQGITAGEANGNALRRSTPFQLLLVNRRLSGMVVQLLWSATVFHGHDVSQMESLISTLYKDDYFDSLSGSDISNPGNFQELACMHQEKNPTSKLCTTTDTVGREGVASHMGSSFTMQRGSTRTTQTSHPVHVEEKGSQLYINKTECYQASRPLKGIGVYQRGGENYMTSIKGGSSSVRDANSCHKHPNMKVGTISHRCHCVAESLCNCFGKNTMDGFASSISNEALLSYRQFVKRVVLNFAHPQASPQLLVRALECIKSRCRNQIQAFDLHANEKMQAAGLETPSELERLFGSGFSKLRYLRLQGGLVDNQLLGALIKGLSTPPMTPCHLSQVFLGPGSVTDSAIDKLIAVAGHSLEVFAVTSCVDVSGGALANLLTKCPKLRVLSVHRSIAKDKELLEGLGIELEDSSSSLSTPSALTAPGPHSSSRKPIIAPLERLELGTVKLTEVGVAEIVKGTCLTLRFLVLEMQHFEEDFLKCVIAPLCRGLEGLYFVEPDHVPQQQRQQQAMQDPGQEAQRPRRRFFDFRRGRRTLESQRQQQHHQLQHHDLQSSNRYTPEHHRHQSDSFSRSGPTPRQSPWLGETSTDEWVQNGDCAFWATNTMGPAISPRSGGTRDTSTENLLINQSRARSFSAYFRAISRRLVSMLSSNGSGVALDADPPAGLENPADVTTDPLPSAVVENEYKDLLERFGVDPKTIEAVLLCLQPSLRVFTAMQTDIIQAALEVPEEAAITSSSEMVLSYDVVQRDRLETFLRLIVLLGALVFGAAVSISVA